MRKDEKNGERKKEREENYSKRKITSEETATTRHEYEMNEKQKKNKEE